MTANFWVSLALFLIALGAFIWVIIKIYKDPNNANREIGFTLMRLGVTYNLSALLLLQLIANLAEAGIVGSLQTPGSSTAPNMIAHNVIALAGIIAALTWIKATREFFVALVSDYHWGKKLALVCLTASIAFLAFLGSIAAPLANMATVANLTHQSTQLNLFFLSVRYDLFDNPAYLAELSKLGLPITYSPWSALRGEMVTSLVLTAFHMFITVWDVMLALKLSLTKEEMGSAFDTDMDDPAKDDKGKKGDGAGGNNGGGNQGGGSGGNSGGNQGGNNNSPTSQYVSFVLEHVWKDRLDSAERAKWVQEILSYATKGTIQQQSEFAIKIADFHRYATAIKEHGKTADGKTAIEVGKEISQFVNDKSGGKLTLPKVKKA